MSELIRAVYEHGHLRLLDPVSLAEGEEIRLAIHSDREQVRMALLDILAPTTKVSDDDVDEAALAAMIDEELRGNVSMSDAIIEERHCMRCAYRDAGARHGS
ncbi:MAG TPA: antitoxin family protein [Chloroflexota bacterium]|nr:antitoxin family protein [Chloroflexota bacterium]